MLKLLGSGEYAVELPNQPAEGHFGLAVNEYTHSTAPNRRFPDLITQRLVKAALDGGPAVYTDDELRELAAHCTVQEKNATKVERQVRKAATALLLMNRIGQQFNGIVTGASEKGTWVRISEPIAEGKVVRGPAGLDVGDRVRVELVARRSRPWLHRLRPGALTLIRNLGLDQLREQRQRFLPAEVARLGRDHVGNAFLHDAAARCPPRPA